MKFISPTLHGVLDYLLCGIFLVIPSVLVLDNGPAGVCYLLAAGYLVMTLCTNMPFGLFGWIPFWMHGGLDLVGGCFLLASPWVFDFAHPAPNSPTVGLRAVFMGAGVAFLLVYAFTNWRPAANVDTKAATA